VTITALICCHNGERYLRETLLSLLAQTRRPDEIIVVDDGSTDGSAAVVEAFGPPVRLIRQTKQGLPASRNHGIAAASSTDIFFIDADDLVDPKTLELLAAAKGDDESAVAIMGFAAFRDDPAAPFQTTLFDFRDFFPEIIEGNFGPQHNRLISKALVVRSGGFIPGMVIYEDWLFWCRVALAGAHLVPVPFVGALYRRHATTMSDTAPAPAVVRGHIRVMEELSAGMLQRDDLMSRHGDRLFWQCWAAMSRARQHQFPWGELQTLANRLDAIARHPKVGPSRPRLLRIVRWLGIRRTERLREAARLPYAFFRTAR
jgi:glycosyltransferase involved in cell wall biosynthesis